MSHVAIRTPRGTYTGWQTVRINRSVEQATGEFSLEITEKDIANILKFDLRLDDRCQILIGKLVVIDGFINLIEPSYTAESHTISVSGRDVTGDLLDVSAILPNGELANVTITQLAETLLRPLNIKVCCPESGAPFDKAIVNGGETIFDVLSNYASQRGLLLYTTGDGVLTIAKPPQIDLKVRLVEGVNIKSASAKLDNTNQYGTYIFHFQGAGGQTKTHTIADPEQRAARVLVQDVELADASVASNIQKRAEWELKVRRAKESRATVTVVGWEYESGKIWNIGQRVRLISDRLGYDQIMLISAVTYTLSDQNGTLAELTLTDPAAYAPESA